jgi:serine/threonine protein kinase
MNSEPKKTFDEVNLNPKEGFAIGKTINGKYVVEKKLGEGGMGLTYLAHDVENINRKVVIKTILKSVSNADGKAAFLKEGEALGRINHDGVVKLYDKGEEPQTGLPYLVMEHCKGSTLTEIIRRRQMNLEKAVGLTGSIAFALNAAHEKGVMHRDLKPDNIMVIESEIESDKIKLIDFGIAKVADSIVSGDSTAIGGFKGTLQYASPDQLNGFQTIVGETYNLAALTYEMLTQTRPFQITVQKSEGESTNSSRGRAYYQLKQLQSNLARNPGEINSSIPAETSKVILKGLQHKDENRYQTPVEFSRALQESAIPQESVNVPQIVPNSASNLSFWKIMLPIAALFVLTAFGLLGYAVWNLMKQDDVPPVVVKPALTLPAKPQVIEKVFSFSFEVHKMKNNMPDGDKFTTFDKTKISASDKFNLAVEREKGGNFYIIEQIGDSLSLIFPTNDRNAKVITTWQVAKPNQTFWLIWSKENVDVLEKSPINQPQLNSFLQNNLKNIEAIENQGKMEIKSSDDLVIYKLSM